MTAEIAAATACMGTVEFLEARGWRLYPWQRFVYSLPRTPVMILSTRQAGKTWLAAGKAYHIATTEKASVSAGVCPDQDKAKRVIERTELIRCSDPGAPTFDPDNTEEVGIVRTGSIIKALPGTIKGVVSHTVKFLFFDESNLTEQYLYIAATPTQAHVDEPWTWALSSAWWKRGWYYDDWTKGTGGWTRVLVRSRWDIKNHRIVPYIPEAQFKAEWKERGVYAFYSDTPTKEFIELELTRHAEEWIRQQYFCEFQDTENAALSPDDISRMWSTSVEHRKIGSKTAVSDIPGRKIL